MTREPSIRHDKDQDIGMCRDELEYFCSFQVVDGTGIKFINTKLNAAFSPETKLFRPKIDWLKAVLIALAVILLYVVIFAVIVIRGPQIGVNDATSMAILLLLCVLLGMVWFSDRAGIFCIRLYQRYAPASVRLRCKQIPSCSEYGILALFMYGPVIGTIKILKRLRRCDSTIRIDFP